MPDCRYKTMIGGKESTFRTTCWVDIDKIKRLDKLQRQAIFSELLKKYWKPVYCYLRRKGYSNEDAKDLTQGFFQDIVLGREFVARADPNKGRFRSFLLTALEHFTANSYRRETAKKRSPNDPVIHLDQIENLQEPDLSARGPDEMFNYAWACDLLDEVLARVKHDCSIAGQEIHWQVFRLRVLLPVMENSANVPMSQICADYGIASEAQASNMIVTVKRRFALTLRNFLRQYVQTDEQVDDEFGRLMAILSNSGAR